MKAHAYCTCSHNVGLNKNFSKFILFILIPNLRKGHYHCNSAMPLSHSDPKLPLLLIKTQHFALYLTEASYSGSGRNLKHYSMIYITVSLEAAKARSPFLTR